LPGEEKIEPKNCLGKKPTHTQVAQQMRKTWVFVLCAVWRNGRGQKGRFFGRKYAFKDVGTISRKKRLRKVIRTSLG
jgi:hypothetical protein